MIMQWQSGETILGQLRVSGAGVDAAIAQLRLSTVLNNAISHPPALPASAIVFIRKLVDPLPRSLRLQRYELRPSAAWQQALNARLESLIASAARPALGAVPANAEAVVFSDRSELLASFASDWCAGQVATRWWWQHLLRKAGAYQIIEELWQTSPEYIPAALETLARRESAATFVKTFSELEARALLKLVARAFRLDKLVRILEERPSATDPYFESEEVSPTLPASSIKPRKETRSKTEVGSGGAPWARWVRETETSGLGPEQQVLLGVSLMLQRAPVQVRARSFAREVAVWHQEVVAMQSIRSDQFTENQIQNELPTRSATPAPATRTSSNPRKSVAHNFPRISSIATQTTTSIQKWPEPIIDRLEEPVLAFQDVTTLPQPVEHQWTNSEPLIIVTTEQPALAPDNFPLIDFRIATEFGGVFYLINLGIYLGFYGDFTTPLKPGIDLNVWDFVAMLGSELAGEDIQNDPVWTLLERLSGREEGDEPGSSEGKAWLEQQTPFIRARLRMALGLSETEDPGPLVCKQPARVCVTPAHVDVFIALADLPIEIRLAGLDRDPGWLPAAGRFINFYFE
jgi:hypothetical protein